MKLSHNPRVRLATFAALTLASGVTAATLVAVAPPASAVTARVMPACELEDGSSNETLPCIWDAKSNGNGVGRSYIIGVGVTGVTFLSDVACQRAERGKVCRIYPVSRHEWRLANGRHLIATGGAR